MFLMFHLRRLDVWPTGDFSVRAPTMPPPGNRGPTPKALDALGAFRPYRSVVAYYAWKVSADPDLFATSSVRAVR
jgi:DNA-3-methyladenine glycosylase II